MFCTLASRYVRTRSAISYTRGPAYVGDQPGRRTQCEGDRADPRHRRHAIGWNLKPETTGITDTFGQLPHPP